MYIYVHCNFSRQFGHVISNINNYVHGNKLHLPAVACLRDRQN